MNEIEHMKKTININGLIFKLMILFPISTVLQGIQIFAALNKILTGTIIVLLTLKIVKTKMPKSKLIILIGIVVVYLFSFIYTKKELDNGNDIFYFGLWVLLFIWLKDNYIEMKNIIKKENKLILNIIIMWNIVVLISFLFSSSYSYTWGNERFFKSFCNSEHRFAGACIFIVALNWIVAQNSNNKQMMLLSVIPFISVYLTGARTYLGIILVLAICIYYIMCKSKRNFYLTIIPIITIMIVITLLTPMGEKFKFTSQTGYWGFWGTITNGRSVFWKADIEAFNELNLIKKVVGNGYNFIYDVNEDAIGARIWGHNDFINILLTYGWIGEIIYLYVFFSFSEYVIKQEKCKKIIKFGYYFIWFFNAMFNMVYTYTCAAMALPFILYALTKSNTQEEVRSIQESGISEIQKQ